MPLEGGRGEGGNELKSAVSADGVDGHEHAGTSALLSGQCREQGITARR